MKKAVSNILKIGLGFVLGSSLTVVAGMHLAENVYVNEDIKISVNGVVQELRDATTNALEYPLTYRSRTYIPLRSVATLLGFNVDYVQDSNTATVDSPDYVRTSTSSGKLTIETLDASDVPLINQYKWFTSPKSANDTNIVKNTVAVKAALVFSGVGTTNNAIHTQTPFKAEIESAQKELLKGRKSSEYLISVEPSSVNVLKYAYSGSTLRGAVVSYRLVLRADGTIVSTADMTSIFIDDGANMLAYVGDIIK